MAFPRSAVMHSVTTSRYIVTETYIMYHGLHDALLKATEWHCAAEGAHMFFSPPYTSNRNLIPFSTPALVITTPRRSGTKPWVLLDVRRRPRSPLSIAAIIDVSVTLHSGHSPWKSSGV